MQDQPKAIWGFEATILGHVKKKRRRKSTILLSTNFKPTMNLTAFLLTIIISRLLINQIVKENKNEIVQ